MSETVKHTPGPWSLRQRLTAFDIEGDGLLVLQTSWHSYNRAAYPLKSEALANARLATAAPDLLAMLKVAKLWLEVDGRYDMQGINAAIDKAEGRNG